MSKTKYIELEGKCAWAKVYENYYNEYNGTKSYVIDLFLDDNELERYKKTGIQCRPLRKPTLDEGTGFKFRRPFKKMINGELAEFGPPKVIDQNGDSFDEPIGNGSTVKVTLSYYEYNNEGGKGIGHRLESVQLVDLVPYESKDSEKVAGATKTATSRKVETPW